MTGKSVVQNELIGDFGAEFGDLPDSPEDLPLSELASAVKSGEVLGKQSSMLISKMISGKMPSGFNLKACTKYLESRWGLGRVRQQHVLLEAILNEPPARLESPNAAKVFLDGCCELYASRLILDLGSSAAQVSQSTVAVDPEAVNALNEKQNQYLTKQLSVLAKHLGVELSSAAKGHGSSLLETSTLTARLDLWNSEVGDSFIDGARPIFSKFKARTYDSWWNWVRIDLAELYHQALLERVEVTSNDTTYRYQRLLNRATPALLRFGKGYILGKTQQIPDGLAHGHIQSFFEHLFDGIEQAISLPPIFRPLVLPSAPHTTIDQKGNVSFSEVPRKDASNMEDYVTKLAGGLLYGRHERPAGRDDEPMEMSQEVLDQIPYLQFQRPKLDVKGDGKTVLEAQLVSSQDFMSEPSCGSSSTFTTNNMSVYSPATTPSAPTEDFEDAYTEVAPLINLQIKSHGEWLYNEPLTARYFKTLRLAAKTGITFQNRCCLVTGAGPGSLGSYLVKGLIEGGGRVVVTTSRFSLESTKYFKAMYAEHGARGSELIVVPFNQASKQDGQSLVDYIYDTLGWDLDLLIPFAAMSENGRDITNIDSTSELAHRMMLTNVLRLMGYTKQLKEQRGYDARPTQVLLPLSPNHGLFGGDGLYSESKIALETLSNRWSSEGWGEYLSVCGAIIGWTRGTGLMSANDLIAEAIERHEVKTFSQPEMALNLLGLLTHTMSLDFQQQPVLADLSGGMHLVPNLRELTTQARAQITWTSNLRKTLETERLREMEICRGPQVSNPEGEQAAKIEPLAELNLNFPKLPDYDNDILPLGDKLRGMVDLDQVIVVTGLAELGPWGNARTRWEMEAFGTFSLEGALEMAWIMGLIKRNSSIDNNQTGWMDAKTGTPIPDAQIKAKYEKEILEHSGIRVVEPQMVNGYDPKQKEFLQEIAIDEDLEPFEATRETATSFKKHHGEKVDIEALEDNQWSVRLRKGAVLLIPRAVSSDRFVAGQLPTGWNPERYGIPKDIIDQVDPITLYTLISVSESLLSSGITDPYEIYQYIHLSEVGNCIGSGAGGLRSSRRMYRGRYVDLTVQNDILQETFINTTAAWVNMLLMSSAGPIQTPVGACATAVESVEIGCEAISTGKAKLCLVGGVDDYGEETTYEFGNMKATSSAEEERAKGRHPSEMSRPTTTSRAGFMESQGAGVQVLMSAKLALDMGVPIYGIVALASTASDKIGRSVPAPGQGVLTGAREAPGGLPSTLLDITYRKQQLQSAWDYIAGWKEGQLRQLKQDGGEASSVRAGFIECETVRQQKQALQVWGNHFWKQNPQISPIRGALATWGLTIDDVDVASLHGTSTVANDANESEVICRQMAHLGRREGNPVLGICQKYLTGHSKGAAGSWMLNGCLQVLNSGVVPGNRNADNVDKHLEEFDNILYSDRTIYTAGVKAFSLTSFGFGQKGGQVIGVHPKYLFSTLDRSSYQAYTERVSLREKKANQRLHETLVNNDVFVAKDAPPYKPSQESAVYLNPDARLSVHPSSKGYHFDEDRPHGDLELQQRTMDSGYASPARSITPPDVASPFHSTLDANPLDGSASSTREETMVKGITERLLGTVSTSEGPHYRIGVDVESTDSLPTSDRTFIARNFSPDEQLYVRSAAGGEQQGYTSLWCAKEAAFKSLGVQGRGAGASLKEIEIAHDGTGKPAVSVSVAHVPPLLSLRFLLQSHNGSRG